MFYITIKLLHIFSVFIYAGFLFTDNLILMRMKKTLTQKKYNEVREYFRLFTKVLVPKALIVAVLSGMILFYNSFGTIGENGLENFQILLGVKAILALWLGTRGVLQVFFGIQPFLFKSHTLPFILTIIIIFLSQIMFSV